MQLFINRYIVSFFVTSMKATTFQWRSFTLYYAYCRLNLVHMWFEIGFFL